jgi:hypothetical protein
VSGLVCYDGMTPEHVAKHYRGDVTYCPEEYVLLILAYSRLMVILYSSDVHFPTLTGQSVCH